jgi:hypothetical protein
MGMDAVSDWQEDQQRQVEQAVFRRLDGTQRGEAEIQEQQRSFYLPRRLPLFSTESALVWMLYAAGILLFVSLGFYAFRVGRRRGADAVKLASPQSTALTQTSLEALLTDAGRERRVARDQMACNTSFSVQCGANGRETAGTSIVLLKRPGYRAYP